MRRSTLLILLVVDDDLGIEDVFVVAVGILVVVVVLLDAVDAVVTASIMVVPPFRFVLKFSASNFFALISSHLLKLSSAGAFFAPPPFANIDSLAKSNLHAPEGVTADDDAAAAVAVVEGVVPLLLLL